MKILQEGSVASLPVRQYFTTERHYGWCQKYFYKQYANMFATKV